MNSGPTTAAVTHPWRAGAALRLLAGMVLALTFAASSWSQVAVSPPQATIKAAFLYQFATYVEWPAGTFQRPGQPLVMAVSGDDEFHADLEQLVTGRTLEGRPIVVRKLAETASASGVHVLFLGKRRESRLREAIESAAGAIVIVTDQVNGLRAGSVINFTSEVSRVRFAVSLAAAEARNLKLSARLLAVAQVIEGKSR